MTSTRLLLARAPAMAPIVVVNWNSFVGEALLHHRSGGVHPVASIRVALGGRWVDRSAGAEPNELPHISATHLSLAGMNTRYSPHF